MFLHCSAFVYVLFSYQLHFSLGTSLVSALAYRSNVAMIFQANYEHTPEKNCELRNGEKQTRMIQEMMDLFVKLISQKKKQTSPAT